MRLPVGSSTQPLPVCVQPSVKVDNGLGALACHGRGVLTGLVTGLHELAGP